MSFHVDYNYLDQMYFGVYSNTNGWITALQEEQASLKALIDSANMDGAYAESLRVYLDSIHNTIIPMLGELLSAHVNNCLLYVRDYQTNVDASLHAIMDEDELVITGNSLDSRFTEVGEIDTSVQETIRSVSDLTSVSCAGYGWIEEVEKSIRETIKFVLESVPELEDKHLEADFAETEEMISSLKAFIVDRMQDQRSFKTDFSVESLVRQQSFSALATAYVAVAEHNEANQEFVTKAMEDENSRVQALQKEYEDYKRREQEANVARWTVTGLCIVGSIAVIALSGGTATPLVVGAVSAVSGATIAGTNAIADQYVEYGTVTDWGKVGQKAVLGGISGFITGYVGAGLSTVVQGYLGTTSVASTLLNSSSTVVRMGTGFVIGGTTEVVSGIVSRGVGTFVVSMIESGGDVSQSFQDALGDSFNLQSIVFDGVLGGVSGAKAAKTKPVGTKVTKENLKQFKETKPSHSPDPNKWLSKGGEIYVDGNGVWTYRMGIDTAVYTNGTPDFSRAGQVYETYEVEGGFDTSNHSKDINKAIRDTGKGGPGSGMTWHHSSDGKTLQLVPTKVHELFRHTGGFAMAKAAAQGGK